MASKEIKVKDLRLSIRKALHKISKYSPAAEQLLLATAMQESDLKYTTQIGGGPALSYFQIEPATHDDIWNNYLKYRPSLAQKVTSLMTSPAANKIDELRTNTAYAAAIARIKYARVAEAIPNLDDISSMAAYWRKYYNANKKLSPEEQTEKESQFIEKWNKYNETE